jgi:MFS transporter, DHA2 family, methylenomycin A resistance protein
VTRGSQPRSSTEILASRQDDASQDDASQDDASQARTSQDDASQARTSQDDASQARTSQARTHASTTSTSDLRSRRATAAALISVCLGFFVIQLDVTIVNVALPAIQREIGGSLAGLQWIVDAYTLALASIMLTAGSAADRAGARKMFMLGLSVFAAGSAACAVAPSLGLLIAARTVQGLGASALLPCSLALLVHQFPDPRQRARALGVWGAMGSLGVALGPVLGGALVAATGWRSIFGVNVPVFLLTVALLRRYVAESPKHPGRRTDVRGLLLGAATLAGLTAAFITAGQQGWLAPLPGALLAAGLIAGAFFLNTERSQPHPLLPLALFRSRNLSGATAVGLIFNLVLYGSLLCLSVYLQQERHEPVLATGLLLLPMSLVVGAGSLASGPLTARFGPRPPMIAGLTLAAAGAALLATARTGTTVIIVGSVLLGLVSLAMPAMTAAVVGAVSPEHAGVASGILNTARQSGGALGVALLGSLLGSARGQGPGPGPGPGPGHGPGQGPGLGPGQGPGHGPGQSLSLHVPLLVATAGYLIAVALAVTAIAKREELPPVDATSRRPAGRADST